jgi:equilibrative nucleoside transporter 1/2/3
MDRVRALFGGPKPAQQYEPLGDDEDDNVQRTVIARPSPAPENPFSLLEYSVFLLLGVAMLWAW